MIRAAEWEHVTPAAGELLTVRVIPTDGGGGRKDAVRVVAMIAVVALSIAIGQPELGFGAFLSGSAGFGSAGAWAAGASAFTAIAGSLAVNGAIGRPGRQGRNSEKPGSAVYSESGRLLPVQDRPDVRVFAMGAGQRPEWERAIGMPVYAEEWDAMAPHTDLSERYFDFVVADESDSRIPGMPAFQCDRLVCPAVCRLELGHTGYLIGSVFGFIFHDAGTIAGTVGKVIAASAVLWNSRLALKAWEALERKILTDACAIVTTDLGQQLGTGRILEVSLTYAAAAGCPGAHVLRCYERES